MDLLIPKRLLLYSVISEYVLKKKRQLFASMDYSYIFVATKVATMKTKPYGVRFNEEDLELLKAEKGILSTQKAVNFLAQFWRENRALISTRLVEPAISDKEVVETKESKSEMVVALEKMRGVKEKFDIVPRDSGLTKFQLEVRKKKFGF